MTSMIREVLEKKGLPLLGKIPFSEGIAEACLQGQPVELAYSRDDAMKIIDKLQTILGFEKKSNNNCLD